MHLHHLQADALQHVGVLTIHKILINKYIHSIYIYICCAFAGLDNEMHSTYIKIEYSLFVI